ncbi:MAG: VPLPA-CTERM sorting domain-containing protein [Pseudomonadota bacterium]
MTTLTRVALAALTLTLAAPVAADAASFGVSNGQGLQTIDFDIGNDTFEVDTQSFGITGPLVFANDTFGCGGFNTTGALVCGLDDTSTIDSSVNIVVIQNFDNNQFDPNETVPTWDTSFNAATAADAIAANTEGDRPGLFLYWNEARGINRLFFSENLADEDAAIQPLYALASRGLDNDVNGALQTCPGLSICGDALANLADLALFTEANFVNGTPQVIPVPAALPMLLAAVGGLGLLRRRRKA